ncbi:uridine 5'-monophosphate synthase isoform X2 [Cylas formicarius]|nr:uridine 5'-monophosphate synthase isoform X2 [Cylas formicarius]
MVMRRKEAKDYGTKKLIEGVFKQGDRCLIVEDVVTSGSSILETVKDLNREGIKCRDAIVLLNREQGGEKHLERHGIKMHAILTLTELIKYLFEEKCVDQEMVDKVKNYITENQVNEAVLEKPVIISRVKMPFTERLKLAKNSVASKLFDIMSSKQTTLCLAIDLTNSTAILNMAEEVGPHICALKTHIDIMEDFHSNFIPPLKDIAERHNFLLIEDRKFADIGKTVELQYSKGLYQISSWASLVTAHSIMGKGVIDGLKLAPGLTERGVFLLAEASSAGNLMAESYSKETVKLATEHSDVVAGIVCQNPLFLDQPGLLQLTPGVKIETAGDGLGQQYNSPEQVVLERGADVVVVGRGITEAKEPATAAELYKKILWKAYSRRVAK